MHAEYTHNTIKEALSKVIGHIAPQPHSHRVCQLIHSQFGLNNNTDGVQSWVGSWVIGHGSQSWVGPLRSWTSFLNVDSASCEQSYLSGAKGTDHELHIWITHSPRYSGNQMTHCITSIYWGIWYRWTTYLKHQRYCVCMSSWTKTRPPVILIVNCTFVYFGKIMRCFFLW